MWLEKTDESRSEPVKFPVYWTRVQETTKAVEQSLPVINKKTLQVQDNQRQKTVIKIINKKEATQRTG